MATPSSRLLLIQSPSLLCRSGTNNWAELLHPRHQHTNWPREHLHVRTSHDMAEQDPTPSHPSPSISALLCSALQCFVSTELCSRVHYIYITLSVSQASFVFAILLVFRACFCHLFKLLYSFSSLPVLSFVEPDIFTFKTIICFQRGNSPLARDSWTSIDDIPRSNCIRRNWVQQLRQHDICVQNGKPTFISITILVTAVDMSLSNSNSNSNYFPISINRSQGVLLSPWWCTTIRWLLL